MFGECHAHIIMDGKNYKEAMAIHDNGVDETIIRKHLTDYQEAGITFLRDGGDSFHVSERTKELAGEYGIDYRTPLYAIHKKGHYGGIVGNGFDTLKTYAGLVQKAKEKGADFIKIMTTGIMDFESCSSITGQDLTEYEVKEMIHIAHQEGLSVMVHANGASAVRIAVQAGADSIEHGNFIDADCIELMKESEVVWVPTITTVTNIIGCGRYDDNILQRIWENAALAIHNAFYAGVRLALGSDAGAYLVPHGQGLYDELSCFQKIIPNDKILFPRLGDGENFIKEKFSPSVLKKN